MRLYFRGAFSGSTLLPLSVSERSTKARYGSPEALYSSPSSSEACLHPAHKLFLFEAIDLDLVAHFRLPVYYRPCTDLLS